MTEKSTIIPVVLGVEGGGTHTVALWADSSNKKFYRNEFECGNIKLLNDSQLENLFRSIAKAGEKFLVQSICVSLAGLVDDEDKIRLAHVLHKIFPAAAIDMCSDLQTPLYAANIPKDHIPVLVLCGTGSCCYAQTVEGVPLGKSGGWGHILGDRGSAYAIGLTTLRKLLAKLDRTGKLPNLGAKILQFQLMNSPREWINWSINASKDQIAALAKIVSQSAAEGDSFAQDILIEEGLELATDAIACYNNFKNNPLNKTQGAKAYFLLNGSMLKKSDFFRKQVSEEILKHCPDATVETLQQESVWGAVRRAIQILDAIPTAPITEFTEEKDKKPSTSSSITEQRNSRSMNLDKLSIEEGIQLMINEDQYIHKGICKQKDKIAELIRAVTNAFKNGGRLFYAGAGTSGRLGVLDASECPPTFGVSHDQVQGIIAGGYKALWRAAEGAEDSISSGKEAAVFRSISENDIVLGIAASGTTPFVQGVLDKARELGAYTALLSFNPNRTHYPIEPHLVINISVEPEILTGSTRLKCGTATKLILNMITTLSMVQTGKVISNLMVNVHPTNNKLRDRAIRILGELEHCDRKTSQTALENNSWNIRQAMDAIDKEK